jgi:hypothetical protein
MKTTCAIALLVANTIIWAPSFAQADTVKHKLAFKAGLFYTSTLHYYGRTDSMKSSGAIPLAELWFTQKLYVSAAPVFVSNAVQHLKYAGTVVTAGYQHNNGKSLSHIYLVKPIYKSNSQLVQSALKAQLSASFTWLNKIVNTTIGADAKLSNHTDYGATAGIDHIFIKKLPKEAKLIVDPGANLYAGTQQFTKTYYEKRQFLIFPVPEQETKKMGKRFVILSYELTAPLIYARGKYLFILSPAYTIPQNLITVSDKAELSEKGKNLFAVTLGGKFNF